MQALACHTEYRAVESRVEDEFPKNCGEHSEFVFRSPIILFVQHNILQSVVCHKLTTQSIVDILCLKAECVTADYVEESKSRAELFEVFDVEPPHIVRGEVLDILY